VEPALAPEPAVLARTQSAAARSYAQQQEVLAGFYVAVGAPKPATAIAQTLARWAVPPAPAAAAYPWRAHGRGRPGLVAGAPGVAVGEAAWRLELRRLEARHGVDPLAAWLRTATGPPHPCAHAARGRSAGACAGGPGGIVVAEGLLGMNGVPTARTQASGPRSRRPCWLAWLRVAARRVW
jgi:hypothetical protein